jgi:hypothetical protein
MRIAEAKRHASINKQAAPRHGRTFGVNARRRRSRLTEGIVTTNATIAIGVIPATTVEALMARAAGLVVPGGSGYKPRSVGRCRALIWGTLNELAIQDRLPPAAGATLRALRFGRAQPAGPRVHHAARPPRQAPIPAEIRQLTQECLSA